MIPVREFERQRRRRRNELLSLGASIYDVRTEGGRGVSPKEDVVREVA